MKLLYCNQNPKALMPQWCKRLLLTDTLASTCISRESSIVCIMLAKLQWFIQILQSKQYYHVGLRQCPNLAIAQ